MKLNVLKKVKAGAYPYKEYELTRYDKPDKHWKLRKGKKIISRFDTLAHADLYLHEHGDFIKTIEDLGSDRLIFC